MECPYDFKKLYKEKCRENTKLKQENKKLTDDNKSLTDEVSKLEKKVKTLELSISRSKTAKGGYTEEANCCNDLNNKKDLQTKVKEFTGVTKIGTFVKIKGTGKTDISDGNGLNLQVKKYSKGLFGQVDRQWVTDLIKNVPALTDVENMLKDLCELPLKDCGKLVDKTQKVKLLSTTNYTEPELDNLLKILNDNKKSIVQYVLQGTKTDKPNYLCGVEHVKIKGSKNTKRSKLTIYKMEDVIDHLATFDFNIGTKKTTLGLGCLTIQRKGGDCGKSTSNQIQFKMVFSSLKIDTKVEYPL